MSEIKKGEYIRTKNGSIFKIIGGTPDNYDIDVDYYDLGKMEDDIFEDLTTFNYNDNGNFIRDITKKHSPDIIDLIEVGDYVNGKKVLEKIGDFYLNVSSSFINDNRIFNNMIHTIVTHEQFASMEYKIQN